MKFADLRWQKLVGKEAIQQGVWTVVTTDGATHTVWAGLKVSFAYAKLFVAVDDAPLLEEKVWVNLGKLAEFTLGQDVLQIKQGGWGLVGELTLLHNGVVLPKTEVLPSSKPPVPAPSQAPQRQENWETWIEDAERFTEALGEESRVIDNSQSSSETVRRITVSREWVQRISLNSEVSTGGQIGIDIKVPVAGGFSASAKKTIKRAYAVSEETTRTYSEEVTITVLPKTCSTITFNWRQVWQKGVVVGRNSAGEIVRVPFEVKLHPTFDQSQTDVSEARSEDG